MSRKSIFVLLALVFPMILLRGAVASGERPLKIEAQGYTSSVVCGKCHLDIYNKWKEGLHARSLDDPIFYTSYIEAYTRTAGKAKYVCLKCHAPTTNLTKDFDMALDITKEGVTCDFCHTIKNVDLSSQDSPFISEAGLTKRGPKKNVSSPVHVAVYSPLFESSELCAGCHEYKKPGSYPILGTYSEWKESPYAAEGVHCQNCHMPLTPGRIVVPEVKAEVENVINEHNLAGGHSISQVRKAVQIKIVNIERKENQTTVHVDVTNSGSGHMVPTGMPSRRLVLNVDVTTSDNKSYSAQRVYRKIMADKKGKELNSDWELIMYGDRVLSDNRLAPKETRKEVFSFAIPADVDVNVKANITYLYEPLALQISQMQIEMSQDQKGAKAISRSRWLKEIFPKK